jgi:predicted DNA-binding protein (UPF0251 family)
MTTLERARIPWRELPHLRIAEAAEIAGISQRAMERELQGADLEIRRIGQLRFITTESFRCWLGESDSGAPAPAPELSADEREAIRRLSR